MIPVTVSKDDNTKGPSKLSVMLVPGKNGHGSAKTTVAVYAKANMTESEYMVIRYE